MKRTSCVLFLCLCVVMGFAQDESSPNGAGNSPRAVPFVSAQPELRPQCDRVHTTKDNNELIAAFAFPMPPQTPCADSIANCSDPVKYLGTDDGCACFACEYGKATQHNICTNVKDDKNALLKRARH